MKESDLRAAFEEFVAAAHHHTHACHCLGTVAQTVLPKDLWRKGEVLHDLLVKATKEPLLKD